MNQSILFALHCGVPALQTMSIAWLAQPDLVYDPAAPLAVVIDSPRGFALQALRTMETAQQAIILTWNQCPEYRLDLWDLGPAALLAWHELDLIMVRRAIQQVAAGAWHQATPGCASLLTLKERVVLRLLAAGWADREIARQLSIEHQSLRNKVTEIYQKLCLGGEAVSSRCLAALYYWGLVVPPGDQAEA